MYKIYHDLQEFKTDDFEGVKVVCWENSFNPNLLVSNYPVYVARSEEQLQEIINFLEAEGVVY